MVSWISPVAVISARIKDALQHTFPNEVGCGQFDDDVCCSISLGKLGSDYQSSIAMKVAGKTEGGCLDIANQIVEWCNKNIVATEYAVWQVSEPGFINIILHANIKMMLADQIFRLFADATKPIFSLHPRDKKKYLVDFSSPNLMKPMHVGHVRSTIIGDALANLYENLGHEVMRISHVGDFGSQFGVLLAYVFKYNLDVAVLDMDVYEVGALYKKAKACEKEDSEFKVLSQSYVYQLQHLDPAVVKVWKHICNVAKEHNSEIYDFLGIGNIVDRGESFYRQFLKETVDLLMEMNLIKISDGAKCVYVDGYYNIDGSSLPVIVEKQNGTYNYSTTDIAALRYRVHHEAVDVILYVVDEGQAQHFSMIFDLCTMAGFLPDRVTCAHVSFGVILGEQGGKLKTREGDPPLLRTLINDAIELSRRRSMESASMLEEDRLQEEDIKILAINAIKFCDLLAQRKNSYVFSLSKMLGDKSGMIQVMYSYARACSIVRKSGVSEEEFYEFRKWPYDFEHVFTEISDEENALLSTLIRSVDILYEASKTYNPHIIAHYMIELSSKFRKFFSQCKVLASDYEQFRILLCECTKRVLAKMANVLGIKMLSRI